jgi:hypothetical protein
MTLIGSHLTLLVSTLLLGCQTPEEVVANPVDTQVESEVPTDNPDTDSEDTATTPVDVEVVCPETNKGKGGVGDPEQLIYCTTPEEGLGILRDTTIPPGATIYLREGVYGAGDGGPGVFNSMLLGTADDPISVRPFPGEHATINGGFIIWSGGYVHWMNLEVTNTSTGRLGKINDRPGAFFVNDVPGHKIINNVIHNVGQPPVGPTGQDEDFEVYGTVFFYNGFYDEEWDNNPRGTAVYGQGSEQGSQKVVRDSISFKNWVGGFKAWGNNAYVKNWTFDGNCAFHNPETQFFVGSLTHPTADISLTNSVHYTGVYLSQRGYGGSVLGYSAGQKGANINVTGNVFWSTMGHAWQNAPVEVNAWEDVEFTDNQLVARHIYDSDMRALAAVQTPPDSANWDRNAYYGNTFHYAGSEMDFEEWQAITKWDANSTQQVAYPASNEVRVRPNEYQEGRANVYILNFEGLARVGVDLSGVLTVGDEFVVRDVEDYFEPVVSGTYDGSTVDFPMDSVNIAPITGDHGHLVVEEVLAHTPTEFGCFVVERGTP